MGVKPYRILCLALLLLLGCGILYAKSMPVLEPSHTRTVKVGIFHAPPIMYIDKQSKPSGMIVDLIETMADKENWKIIWVVGTASELLKQGKNNQLDLLTFLGYTDERAQYLDYSKESIMTGWGQVYTHSKSVYETIHDFDQATVAIVYNEVNGDSFKKLCETFEVTCHTRIVKTYPEAFQLLEKREVDGAVAGSIVGQNYTVNRNIYPTPVLFSPKKAMYATAKDKNKDLMKRIDYYTKKWRSDSESPYFIAYKKWFADSKSQTSSWVINLLIGSSVLLLVSFIAAYFLKRKVNTKTNLLKNQSDQIRQFMNLMPHIIVAADLDNEVLLINKSARKFLGFKDDANVETVRDLISKHSRSKDIFYNPNLINSKSNSTQSITVETRNVDQETVTLEVSQTPFVSTHSNKPALLTVATDITDAKRYQKQIEHMSQHDPLTGLPNRALLNDRISQSMALATRHSYSSAILVIDINNFKAINEAYAHSVGDDVLIKTSERMASHIKKGDTLARLSGDAFVILLNELSADSKIAEKQLFDISERLKSHIMEPIKIDSLTVEISVSIGMLIYPFDGKRVDRLISRAETAMRHAKSNDDNQAVRFNTDMEAALFQKHMITKELTQALKNKEFFLHYQPQYSSKSPTPIGFEALVRWQHKKHGVIYPSDFIRAVEENGLIIPLGYWIIEECFIQAEKWQKDFFQAPFISINLSVLQLTDKNLIKKVRALLQTYKVEPSLIEFEITETVLFNDFKDSLATLDSLKKLGVRLSIDDFGTGYSSLSYLKRLPLDKIKVDRSFVKDITIDRGSQAIVKTVISMADDLGMELLAEGVENLEQIAFLQEAGCNYYQGYYYSKPLSSKDIDSFYGDLSKDKPVSASSLPNNNEIPH